MGCTVDFKDTGETYTSCVLEYNKPGDCSHAMVHEHKEQCKYWEEDVVIPTYSLTKDGVMIRDDKNGEFVKVSDLHR